MDHPRLAEREAARLATAAAHASKRLEEEEAALDFAEVACGTVSAALRKAAKDAKIASGKVSSAAEARARAVKVRQRLEAALAAADTSIASERAAEALAKTELRGAEADVARIGEQLGR